MVCWTLCPAMILVSSKLGRVFEGLSYFLDRYMQEVGPVLFVVYSTFLDFSWLGGFVRLEVVTDVGLIEIRCRMEGFSEISLNRFGFVLVGLRADFFKCLDVRDGFSM